MFPHLTHLNMLRIQPQEGQVSRICQLLICPSVTHLEAGQACLDTQAVRFRNIVLPPNLEVLRCRHLVIGERSSLPAQLHLGRLERLEVFAPHSRNVQLDTLAALLSSAPSLRSLTFSGRVGNTIFIGQCTPSVARDVQLVAHRMSAGFDVSGLDLMGPRAGPGQGVQVGMPLRQFLPLLPQLPTFHSCKLAPAHRDKAGSLSLLARVFPELRELGLSGTWMDAEVDAEASLGSLRTLRLTLFTTAVSTILRLVACMPQLMDLHHSSWYFGAGHTGLLPNLDAALQASHLTAAGVVSGSADVSRLGGWIRQTTDEGRGFWKRNSISDEGAM